MFGTLGGPEIFLILVIALIVFGPRRLPEIGKTMGRMLGEFRRASNDFKRTLEEEVESENARTATPPVSEPVAPATDPPATDAAATDAAAASASASAAPVTQVDAYESTTVTAADLPADAAEAPATATASAAPAAGAVTDTQAPAGEPGTVSRPDSRPIEPR